MKEQPLPRSLSTQKKKKLSKEEQLEMITASLYDGVRIYPKSKVKCRMCNRPCERWQFTPSHAYYYCVNCNLAHDKQGMVMDAHMSAKFNEPKPINIELRVRLAILALRIWAKIPRSLRNILGWG